MLRLCAVIHIAVFSTMRLIYLFFITLLWLIYSVCSTNISHLLPRIVFTPVWLVLIHLVDVVSALQLNPTTIHPSIHHRHSIPLLAQ